MKVDTWLAVSSADYPGPSAAGSDDTKLPIKNVMVRVAYGADYKGDAEVLRLKQVYADQGIGFFAVVVPTATNLEVQLDIARSIAKLPVAGIQFDAEPYPQFLGGIGGMQYWLENVLVPLSQGNPEPELSLCYDPREQWLTGWGFERAKAMVDSLAPMVYTADYAGQGKWGDPVQAVQGARAQCPSGRIFRPLLQTYNNPPGQVMASYNEAVRLAGQPCLFRRGTTSDAVWQAIAGEAEPQPQQEDPLQAFIKAQGDLNAQLSAKIDGLVQWVQHNDAKLLRRGDVL